VISVNLQPRSCPLCGSTDCSNVIAESNYDQRKLGEFAFASRKTPEFMHFRMVRCSTCDLLYATPAPDVGWVRTSYRDAPFDTREESCYAAAAYARHLPEIVARLPDRRGALDIGTGDGAFLERLLHAGFTRVVGVEPSRAPVEQAEPRIQRLIRQGFFPNGEFESDSLSLITCFQALEHTDNPSLLMGAAYKLVKPGGAFYAVAHNYRALSARLLKTRSPIYDIEHLQLLSPHSFRLLLERAGFEDVTVRPIRNDYPLSYWVKLLPVRSEVKARFRGGLARLHLGGLCIPLRVGNMMAVGYKPGSGGRNRGLRHPHRDRA
jgi:SAM-dependent methyltransferase